jgi:hypothetical protein
MSDDPVSHCNIFSNFHPPPVIILKCTVRWYYFTLPCRRLQTVQNLLVPNIALSVSSVSLGQLVSDHFLSVRQRYDMLYLCHYVDCFILYFAQSLSINYILSSVSGVSLFQLPSSKVCLLYVNTSHSICVVAILPVTLL